jgi:vancomycin permeability regulator SanA
MNRTKKRNWLRVMMGIITLGFLVLALLVGSGLNDRIGHADIALVLGNQVSPEGKPSPRLKARLDKAAELYREGWFPRIMVSGATGREGYPEGTAMKEYLVGAGIPAEAVIVDDAGVDTWASAGNTADLLRGQRLESVFVITQFYHVPRSRLALSKFGVGPLYNAHADYFEWRDLYSTLRELPAWVKYALASSAQP